MKDVPRVEQLESHLANRILEQEAIKKQLEKLRIDKEKETQTTQQKHEQDMKAMREEMNQQFSQIMSMIQQNPRLAQIKPEALTGKKLTVKKSTDNSEIMLHYDTLESSAKNFDMFCQLHHVCQDNCRDVLSWTSFL